MGLTKLDEGIDPKQMLAELAGAPELWDLYPQRLQPESSPHKEVSDIWLRFANINTYAPTEYGEMTKFHTSCWYEAIDKLPSVKLFVMQLMAKLQGEQLGGVLISKLPPGKSIASHTDHDWHSFYYSKYHLLLQGTDTTIYAGNDFLNPEPGTLFSLNCAKPHGVINNGNEDRIALIACVKTDDNFRVEKL